jgi:hypothetical protein
MARLLELTPELYRHYSDTPRRPAMRETTQPTLDKYGAEEHPAFGMIRASRTTVGGGPGAGAVLFDSDIKHGHTVRIVIERATRKRDLNHDWIHGGQELVEIEMSEAQWASFVSSMNTSGVPCTLRRTETDIQVPGLPYAPRLAESMAEVKNAAVETFGKIRAARDDYEQAVAEKAGAKVIKEKLRTLHYAIENSGANMTFAAKTLAEHAENVVQKARADIEAMVYQQAALLGLTGEQAQGLLELPVLDGEEVLALDPPAETEDPETVDFI